MTPDLRYDAAFFALLTRSYADRVGVPLVPQGTNAAWLYEAAPFVVVAHNTDADPRFVYANKWALACFEYSWEEFVTLPSRLSAEAPAREERTRILQEVARNGCVRDYNGVRISKSGRRFRIEDCVVWQLNDGDGVNRGQAARFSSWADI